MYGIRYSYFADAIETGDGLSLRTGMIDLDLGLSDKGFLRVFLFDFMKV